MNRSEIIKAISEAGASFEDADELQKFLPAFYAFEKIVSAKELERCIRVAGLVRLGLSQRYDENIKNDCAIMVGNTDWFRLTGAVRVVEALRQLVGE